MIITAEESGLFVVLGIEPRALLRALGLTVSAEMMLFYSFRPRTFLGLSEMYKSYTEFHWKGTLDPYPQFTLRIRTSLDLSE